MNEGDFVRLYQRGTANRRDAARVGCVPPEALLAVVEQQGSEEERLASINHAMTCADCGCLVDRGVIITWCDGHPDCCCAELPVKPASDTEQSD